MTITLSIPSKKVYSRAYTGIDYIDMSDYSTHINAVGSKIKTLKPI